MPPIPGVKQWLDGATALKVVKIHYLRPGFEHGQRLHGEGALIIDLTWNVSPHLNFGERGSQKLMYPSQVTQVTDDPTGDPCTANLNGNKGSCQNSTLEQLSTAAVTRQTQGRN